MSFVGSYLGGETYSIIITTMILNCNLRPKKLILRFISKDYNRVNLGLKMSFVGSYLGGGTYSKIIMA